MKSHNKLNFVKWIRSNLPYIIIFAAVLGFELIFYRPAHDEVALRKEFFNKYGFMTVGSVIDFIISKLIRDISGWSSRLIINCVSNFMVLFPGVWYLCNALMFTLMSYSLLTLFGSKDEDSYIIVPVLILAVPQSIFTGAGLLITTIAYLWPMEFISYIMSYIYRREQKLPVFPIAFLFLSVLYAANEELISAFLLIMFLYGMIVYKRLRKIIFPLEVITLTELIWALVSPGNSSRSKAELIWFADFNNLSLIKKLEMGFSSTMNEFFLKDSLIMITFTAFLMLIYLKSEKKSIVEKFISTLPFGFSLFGFMLKDLSEKYQRLSELYHCMSSYGLVNVKNYGAKRSYLPLMLFVFFGGLIVILVAGLEDYSRNSIGVALALLMSVGARTMMGLSPTIWASGLRTFSIVYYTIDFALLWIIWHFRKNRENLQIYIVWLSCISAVELGGFIAAL